VIIDNSNMQLLKATALVALLGATQSTAQKIKFMPLGDSITEITCWRAYVWDQFAAANLSSQVDFVGSMTNNPQNCKATAANFDLGHEGHSGWLGIDIANNNLQGWLASTKPDIVQFMLGTNDIAQGRTTDAVIQAYTKMVGLMRASNPNMKIIVDKVIPLSFNQNGINTLNARIPAWATGLNTTQSPIWIADCSLEGGFTTAMLRDGVHPNDQGDRLMASKIGPLLVRAVQGIIANRTGVE